MPKKENIRKMFDNIAPSYDFLNHLMSLGIDRIWRRNAIKVIADTRKPLQVLDVACGTGDFSIGIAKAASPGSRVTGVDLSENMLGKGRLKVAGAGLEDRIVMEAGDCEHLRYNSGNFDRVSVAFGVRNFEHLDLGLKEMLRVLKPGGKAVILELSLPDNPILGFLFNLYFLHILPAIGGIVSGDKAAYKYLPSSVRRFPKPYAFKSLLKECGFENIYDRAFSFGICRMFVAFRPGDILHDPAGLQQEFDEPEPCKHREDESRDDKQGQHRVESLS